METAKTKKANQARTALTGHQIEQLQHLERLCDNDGDGSGRVPVVRIQVGEADIESKNNTDESNEESLDVDALRNNEQVVRKRKSTKDKLVPDKEEPTMESPNKKRPASLPPSVLQNRQAKLQQLDLAIDIRTKLEACLQSEPNRQEASDIMLQRELVDSQLRLVALSEAVAGGYTLANYDYYVRQYNDQFTDRTTPQEASRMLQTGVSTISDYGASQSSTQDGDP